MISEEEKRKLKEKLQKYFYDDVEIKFNFINIENERKIEFNSFKLVFSFLSFFVIIGLFIFINIFSIKRNYISINNKVLQVKLGEVISSDKEKLNINLTNKAEIILYENSKINFVNLEKNKTIVFLSTGKAFFEVRKGEKEHFIVKTPSLEVSVRGTKFLVVVNVNKEEVHVVEGIVNVQNISNNSFIGLVENEAIVLNRDTELFEKEKTDITKISNIIYPDLKAKKEVTQKKKLNKDIERLENLIYLDEKTIIFSKKDIYIYQTGDYLKPSRKISIGDNVSKITPYMDKIIVNGENGGLYAFSIDGEYLWGNIEAGVLKFYSKPVIKNDYIYLATVDKGIQIFSMDGRLIDNIKRGEKKAIYNSPVVVDDGSIIYLNESGELIRYDFLRKKNIWVVNIEDRVTFPFFEYDGILYLVVKSRSEVMALSVDSGEVLWKRSVKDNIYVNNFYLYGGYLILGTDEGVTIFNKNNGEIDKRFDYEVPIKQAITETNRLYVLGIDNRVIVYSIPDLIKIYEQKFNREIKRISFYNGKILVYGNNNFCTELKN